MSDVQTGLTPGRKIKAAMWMSLWISASAASLHAVGVPEQIIQWVLGITGLGWLGAILGQAGIDAFSKYAEAKKTP